MLSPKCWRWWGGNKRSSSYYLLTNAQRLSSQCIEASCPDSSGVIAYSLSNRQRKSHCHNNGTTLLSFPLKENLAACMLSQEISKPMWKIPVNTTGCLLHTPTHSNCSVILWIKWMTPANGVPCWRHCQPVTPNWCMSLGEDKYCKNNFLSRDTMCTSEIVAKR